MVENSMPGTISTPSSSPAENASSRPLTESWSVNATVVRPRSTANSTIWRGVNVPSEKTEWTCRSMPGMAGYVATRTRVTHRANGPLRRSFGGLYHFLRKLERLLTAARTPPEPVSRPHLYAWIEEETGGRGPCPRGRPGSAVGGGSTALRARRRSSRGISSWEPRPAHPGRPAARRGDHPVDRSQPHRPLPRQLCRDGTGEGLRGRRGLALPQSRLAVAVLVPDAHGRRGVRDRLHGGPGLRLRRDLHGRHGLHHTLHRHCPAS